MRTDVVIGQTIYVGNSFFIDHGEDDFQGGRAVVTAIKEGISAGKPVLYVCIDERPGWEYNWDILAEKQEELERRFGDQIAYEDPDYYFFEDDEEEDKDEENTRL